MLFRKPAYLKPALSLGVAATLVLLSASGGLAASNDAQEIESEITPMQALLDLGRAGHLDSALMPILEKRTHWEPHPADLVSQAKHLLQTYSSTESTRDVLLATADMEGIAVPHADVSSGDEPAVALLLEMYALLGITPTLPQANMLSLNVAALDEDAQRGLSILLDAVNRGLVLQETGTQSTNFGAATLALDAADAVHGLFTAPTSAGSGLPLTSSTSSQCDPLFEDPLFLVRIGSPCDDTVNATARVLVYDPAGDDTYNHNAGGAFPGLELDLLTPERRTVPFAIHVDEAGNDSYMSSESVVQGSANSGGIGILLDRGGNDDYTCAVFCQAYANNGGLAVFSDEGGNDSYVADRTAQASGNGAFLVDQGGDDEYTLLDSGGQAGLSGTLIPAPVGTLLLDQAGNDKYVAGHGSQGAAGRLIDLEGDDRYTATFQSQGAGFAQTTGFLIDGDGMDVYTAERQAQGYGTLGSAGALVDFGTESDSYTLTGDGIGQGASEGANPRNVGLLYDEAGDEVYSGTTMVQGAASSLIGSGGLGALVDPSGNDIYIASGQSQGAASQVGGVAPSGLTLGLLLDGNGDDDYTSGDNSQGSSFGGSAAEAGLLIDAGGQDDYRAGGSSQGSGGAGGIGVLVDHTRTSEGEKLFPDDYDAGDFSQGSSGPDGGVGILMDLGDREGGKKSSFAAGANSQGSAAAAGVGILLNRDGTARDTYNASGFSQGSSTGGLGLLLDRAGKDSYDSTDADTSQGFGNSTYFAGHLALGLLFDFDGRDGFDEFHGQQGNEECRTKGDIGFVIDMNLADTGAVPSGCPDAALAAVDAVLTDFDAQLQAFVEQLLEEIDQTIQEAQETVEETHEEVNETVEETQQEINETIDLLLNETEPAPPADSIFFDDFEDGANGWTVTGNDPLAAEWQLVNETLQPQLSPNARSGDHYWYAGLQGGAAYGSFANATLTSPVIDLTSTTSAEFRAWIAGSSERGFDQLTVRAYEAANPSNEAVLAILDGGRTGVELVAVGEPNPLPVYEEVTASLDGFAGTSIHLEFNFFSDSIYEDGQGWNVDDVAVV